MNLQFSTNVALAANVWCYVPFGDYEAQNNQFTITLKTRTNVEYTENTHITYTRC